MKTRKILSGALKKWLAARLGNTKTTGLTFKGGPRWLPKLVSCCVFQTSRPNSVDNEILMAYN
jgi:hypothetical protein